jgi:hypothetical protein
MTPKVHQLKTWAPYFDAVARGEKNFEGRRDDRGFQRGDIVELLRCEKSMLGSWEVERNFHTGEPEHVIRKRISYILMGGQFGIEAGYVVMSLQDIEVPNA